jgi:hypothetical protein
MHNCHSELVEEQHAFQLPSFDRNQQPTTNNQQLK